MEFVGFPKIPRYSRDCIVSEKIDGTNGQILITEDSQGEGYQVQVGSRLRWLGPTQQEDNYGFFAWVTKHADELKQLGPGRHFGEWWGQGIQRGYNKKEKCFSLFNVIRWNPEMFSKFKVEGWRKEGCKGPMPEFKAPPACCGVVPVITTGPFGDEVVNLALNCLEGGGSYAAPGFMKPEGIVIYHTAGNLFFKKTLERDEMWKGEE